MLSIGGSLTSDTPPLLRLDTISPHSLVALDTQTAHKTVAATQEQPNSEITR